MSEQVPVCECDHAHALCVEDCHENETPLWGEDGPEIGQVITIKGTSMQTRWTGTHWELFS